MRRKDRGDVGRRHSSPSIEEYMKMSEAEKDLAIQRAVMRLQTRIQEILFLLDREGGAGSENRKGKEVKKNDEKP